MASWASCAGSSTVRACRYIRPGHAVYTISGVACVDVHHDRHELAGDRARAAQIPTPRAEFGNPRREESREPLPRDLFISHSNTSTLTLHPTLYPDKQASDGSRATPRTSTPSRSSPRRQPRTQRLAKKPRRPTQSNTPW